MTAPRILPQNVDYTDRDFDALRARLFAMIPQVYPTWSDTQVSNFGNILVEVIAFMGDVIGYYQDSQAGEAFMVTAKLRRSLINLAKGFGFVPPGASAATVDVAITLAAAVQAGATFTIPRGDRVKTADVTEPIFYQFLEDAIFLAGETTKTVTVEQSEFQEAVQTSTELADQTIVLSATPYLDGSAVVVFANGTYGQVDDFLDSTASDRHFTVSVDQGDRATLRFGSGVNGAIPQGTGEIEYRTGGGEAGRVEAGKLNRFERTSYTDSLGAVVTPSVTNPEAASGGSDRATNAQIAQLAPQSLRVLERAIAREDFEIVAESTAGVARALALTKNEYEAVGENQMYLSIVPVGLGTATTLLLDTVSARFSKTGSHPKGNTLDLQTVTSNYLDVDISTIVYLVQGAKPATVRAAIIAAIQALFALTKADGSRNEAINFGYYLDPEAGNDPAFAWSDIFNAIRDTVGVLRVDPGGSGLLLNGARQDVGLTPIQFPRLGDIVIKNGATGLDL